MFSFDAIEYNGKRGSEKKTNRWMAPSRVRVRWRSASASFSRSRIRLTVWLVWAPFTGLILMNVAPAHIHVNGTQAINAEEVKTVSRKLDISTQVSCSRHDHTQSHLNDVHWAGKYDAIEHTCKSPAERARVPSTAKRNGKRCDASHSNVRREPRAQTCADWIKAQWKPNEQKMISTDDSVEVLCISQRIYI